MSQSAPHQAKKSVENTVFVRFQPSSDALRRHHVEDCFSEVGPIKKCSVIHSATNSYGFVKFTTQEDAELAAVQLDKRKIRVDGGVSVTVHCELAKTEGGEHIHSKKKKLRGHSGNNGDEALRQEEDDPSQKKKTNRLIIRNLSFYAKEKDIRQALEPFGELMEVHIPKVVGGSKKGITTHRGFGFVTFASEKSVRKCLPQSTNLVIKDRPVNIARSLHKTAHQAQQHKTKASEKFRTKEIIQRKKRDESKMELNEEASNKDSVEGENDGSSSDDDDDSASSTSENDSEDDSDSDSADDDDDDDDDKEKAGDQERKSRLKSEKDETAVEEKRCLFLRNLPFDCTRHDIFEIFRQYGFITAIYIVKDKETGKIPRGTGFVSFRKPEQANKALEAAASSSFVSQRNVTVEERWENSQAASSQGIVLKGRRLLVDLAVDKGTASALTVGEKKSGDGEGSGKDRRNLYLKGEGRVENDEQNGTYAWDELPETDKTKRQTAWSEKNTKLRSPLFFINPYRLSFRNLAKHVDESDLKQLCVDAIQRGLERNLVTAEDQIALWRARGEMTTRQILARVQEADESKEPIIPAFNPKNVKRSIPSVHVHRDYIPGANKHIAPSRGFGFVEFEHHAHALACLREVNNNPRYSAEFATGGKQAAEMKRRRAGKKPRKQLIAEEAGVEDSLVDPSGKVRTPRLIVEFAVENKAKAKQQAAHRAQQQANQQKQLEEHKSRDDSKQGKAGNKKKSRGKKQRERKRKQFEEGGDASADISNGDDQKVGVAPEPVERAEKKTKRGIKPPKKQKIDKAEDNFTKLVESYRKDALAIVNSGENAATVKSKGKRWFED